MECVRLAVSCICHALPSVSAVCAAKCEDQSEEAVSKKAAELGVVHSVYSCARAKSDGACSLVNIAKEFCPKTCELCNVPPPWTWCRISGGFCLASQSFCDSNTKCGDPLKSASRCRAAAADLGLNSTIIEVDSIDAPYGCFQAMSDHQQSLVYHNKNDGGSFSSKDLFAKSLCSTRRTGNHFRPTPQNLKHPQL